MDSATLRWTGCHGPLLSRKQPSIASGGTAGSANDGHGAHTQAAPAASREAKAGADVAGAYAPAALIMDGPERFKHTPGKTLIVPALAGKRAGDTEPDIVVPVVRIVPVAVGGAEVRGIVVPSAAAQHAPTRGRSGLEGWIEPSSLEDRMAKAPRVGVSRVRNPGTHALFDLSA